MIKSKDEASLDLKDSKFNQKATMRFFEWKPSVEN